MILSLLLSLVPASLMAQGPVSRTDLTPVDRTARPLPELLPQEVLDFFGDGLTVDEFVARTGYVPRALEGLVDREVLVIIQLEEQPAALVYAEAKASGEVMAQASLDSYRRGLEVAQTQVMAQATALGAREISRYDTVYNGIQVSVPANRLAEIAALPGVVSVRRAPIHTPSLAEPASLASIGNRVADLGYTGDGLVIGIIDTGIDYTHAAFGGSGDPADYANNDPDVREPDSFPTWKVIGGYDFAGTNYDAGSDDPDIYTPRPDNDPLDEYGHGTHVAAIAAGLPVTPTLQPGVAPAAGLIAYKVFGKGGSTSLTMDALEMATENYIVFGYPDVINMSLGSPFGSADPLDPDVAATDAASAAGIVVVASAGNEGPYSYITGSPGVASSAISVAATTTGMLTGPTVSVVGSGLITQTNIIYQPPAFDNGTGQFTSAITGTMLYAGDLPGATVNTLCDTSGIAADALDGALALIQRGTCAFSDKVNNAAALGAVGAIIYNNTPMAGRTSMSGSSVAIPAGFITLEDGVNLVPADGMVTHVSAVDQVTTVPDPYVPADNIAGFSSRGPRGYDSFLKPEVAAPGVSIFAADMGSGTTGVGMSGTSMAAPYVAGVAALVREAHPDWTPEMVKAAIMNTAVDLADDTVIPLAGSGRVDPYAATTTELLAIADPDLVSLGWGVEYSSAMTVTVGGPVTLYNNSTEDLELDVSVDLQDGSENEGVLVDITPDRVTVLANGQATVDVAITFDLTLVPMRYGPLEALEEYFGYLTFMPTMGYGAEGAEAANGLSLIARVPFYGQVKPYAVLDVTGDEEIIHPIFDYATLEVSASGPVTSSLWAYPALVATDAPNPAVAPSASVRMFGMDYGWADPSYGDIIAVAIDAWAPWHVPQPYFSEFDLYLDPTNDGVWDYVDFNFNYGWYLTGSDDNTWVVVQVDLAANMLYLASPYAINSDYNNSLMEWYLPAAWQDLGATNSAFAYQLVGWDQYGTPDVTPAGRFDYLDLPLWWSYYGDPGLSEPETWFWAWVNRVSGHNLAKPVGLMILDYAGNPNNDDGAQAYLAPISLFYKQLYWFPFMAKGAPMP